MELVTGLAIAVVTAVLVVTGAVVAGFVMLFRRRGDRGLATSRPSGMPALQQRAGSALVRLDDAVREADTELGFALAQFGRERAQGYADALAAARGKLTEAFRLRQALDDAVPDSDRDRRAWTLQIIALCEQAQTTLDDQAAEFARLRGLEVNAAGTLRDVRSRIDVARARVPAATETLQRLTARYAPHTFAHVTGSVEAAQRELDESARAADTAEPGINAHGVSAVAATLQQAALAAHRAAGILDAVDRVEGDLAAADEALERLRASARDDLAEAREQRDQAPDAPTGRAIIDAMAAVEAALAPREGAADPVAELDRIGAAIAGLDLALASARNQAQRLRHAREAYESTLVSARSQIAAARDFIARRGGGAAARTRLAEAQRQLALAQAAAGPDPVEALDTVRRAVTHARDADALARYDAMGR